MTGKSIATSPGTLDVYVLSEAIGESVVVVLPDGRWFVVDAYHGRVRGATTGHAVLRFIDALGLDPSLCQFVLITHMHQDHYSGVTQLIASLRTGIATSSVYRTAAARVAWFDALNAKELTDREDLATGFGISASGILRLCRRDYQLADQWQPLMEQFNHEGHPCSVTVFSPPADELNDYLDKVVSCWSALKELDDNTHSAKLRQTQNVLINNMSVGVHLRFGDCRVLLPGDLEEEAWRMIGHQPVAQQPSLSVGNILVGNTLLKASHHGSSRAWCEGVVGSIMGEKACAWAISSHHNRGTYKLPDVPGIQNVLGCGVVLGVPNASFLASAAKKFVDPNPRLTRRPIPYSPKPHGAAELIMSGNGAEALNASPATREVHWIGAKCGPDGRTIEWFGGTNAAFLTG